MSEGLAATFEKPVLTRPRACSSSAAIHYMAAPKRSESGEFQFEALAATTGIPNSAEFCLPDLERLVYSSAFHRDICVANLVDLGSLAIRLVDFSLKLGVLEPRQAVHIDQRELEFRAYISGIVAEDLGKPLADRTLALWRWLRGQNAQIPLPAAEPIRDELSLQLTWRRASTVHSIEIVQEGLSWYFRNRETGASDGGDVADLGLPLRFVSELGSLGR